MPGKKVLIVDDDKELLRALSIRLGASGYSVVLATDGITAVSVARKEMPHVIILDIGLPGLDGFKVIERLRSIIDLSAIPIIVITAKDPSTAKTQALNAGAVAFLPKPLDNDALLAAIRQAAGESATDSEQKPSGREQVSTPGKKILLVDDDKELLKALHVRLKASGYNVVFATDSLTALRIAREEVPDVIILDIGLPGGDGFTLMERLRYIASLCTTPIIVISARDPHTTKHRALSAGAQTFIQKPVDNNLLLAAIQKALGKSGEQPTGKGEAIGSAGPGELPEIGAGEAAARQASQNPLIDSTVPTVDFRRHTNSCHTRAMK